MMNTVGPRISYVVIGRNEGERLTRCLESIRNSISGGMDEIIYVDSNSSDNSLERAESLGARVLSVKSDRPTAALGRNAGWKAAHGEYIMFLDGDTNLDSGFITKALAAMTEPDVAVVWGHRRESDPGQSVYVRVLDLDWIYPAGDSAFCGGDALMRRCVLEDTGGFDATLIAGEEPELCSRIRAKGLRIQHIDAPMTQHDLAIKEFSAYWQRAFRAGHAYAEVSARFKDSPDNLWRGEVRRNLLHGAVMLSAPVILLAGIHWTWLGVAALTAGCGVLARTMWRCKWKDPNPFTRFLYAIHAHVQQIPILFGQISFRIAAVTGNRRKLIEYKK